MNAPFKSRHGRATIFTSNRSQAVRLPKALAFPEGVKDLRVIREGVGLLLVPADAVWSDFLAEPGTEIVMPDDPIDESIAAF